MLLYCKQVSHRIVYVTFLNLNMLQSNCNMPIGAFLLQPILHKYKIKRPHVQIPKRCVYWICSVGQGEDMLQEVQRAKGSG